MTATNAVADRRHAPEIAVLLGKTAISGDTRMTQWFSSKVTGHTPTSMRLI